MKTVLIDLIFFAAIFIVVALVIQNMTTIHGIENPWIVLNTVLGGGK